MKVFFYSLIEMLIISVLKTFVHFNTYILTFFVVEGLIIILIIIYTKSTLEISLIVSLAYAMII